MRGYPHWRPDGGLLDAHTVLAATALQKEVDCQHDEHDNRESAHNIGVPTECILFSLHKNKTAMVRRR